ncbi:MAG TPA: M67 family metallopeptidase [Solirubrobacterales bacterium]|nr:M67 family metallopeptidase [Solirubrobacterales bacterium]
MRISKSIYEELLEHARAEAPNECCGLIGGENGEAQSVYRARNAEASPLRYNLDPQDQFRIMSEMEERGEELAAIYHSHTASPAYPSQTDINLAAYPNAIYLIVSLAEDEVQFRGFEIRDGEVTEVDLAVE